MKSEEHFINARVWIWKGDSAWHFITIEKEQSLEIKKDYIWPRRGFGSIPVNVTVGKTFWKTSVFPEKEGKYILPLKKEVRTKEKILVGQFINIKLQVVT